MRPKVKRRLKRIGVGSLVVYITVMAIAFATHLPDYLIIHAAPGAMESPNAVDSVMDYRGGKLEICKGKSAEVLQGKSVALFVLFFVGNEDRVNLWTAGVAQMWEESTGLATEAWGVNLPGFGLSSGPAYLGRIGAAGLAAFDAVKAEAGERPIVIQAASLGTLAALDIAAHRKVAGMTIQDPPPLRDLIWSEHGWWNGWLFAGPVALWVPWDINSVWNARECSARCVFITSERDTVIPPALQRRIVDAYRGEKRWVVIPGGKHCSQPDAVTAEEIAGDRRWLVGQ